MSFGLDTLRRLGARVAPSTWSNALLALALLLVPWTALLASVDGDRWFGDTSIQAGWVAFDTLMIIALSTLAWLVRSRKAAARPVALLLAGATGTDFVLTAVQAANLHASVEGTAVLFVTAGVMGPLLATTLLVFLADASPRSR